MPFQTPRRTWNNDRLNLADPAYLVVLAKCWHLAGGLRAVLESYGCIEVIRAFLTILQFFPVVKKRACHEY